MIKYIALLSLLLFFSCGKDTTNRTEEKEIEFRLENLANRGWKSKKVNQYINEINYTATEVPNAYYIIKNEGLTDLKNVDSIINSHKNERVIELEFAQIDGKDLLTDEFTNRSYEDAVKYMAFTINKDFKAVGAKSKDTFNCVGVQFERNFKVAPFKRAMLYFTGIPEDETIQLIYDDELFGNGRIKFNLKNQILLD
ncbi:MAG: hypothetical protein HRT68_13295 [Flavobacteriaceae bacterium]|nr:hypothetical protein [Flavobacteriaceae bacterium]